MVKGHLTKWQIIACVFITIIVFFCQLTFSEYNLSIKITQPTEAYKSKKGNYK